MQYGYTKTIDMPFEQARERLEEELQKEGFGVLTEINVKETFKKKLNVDFRKYIILGACNPSIAYKALQAEEQLGLFLPCNVIVYENDEGKTVISSMEVMPLMNMIGNPVLDGLAPEIQELLHKVIDSV